MAPEDLTPEQSRARETALALADPTSTTAGPQDWEKAKSVAYLRMQGHDQKTAALAAEVSERTVQRWEASDWWPQVVDDAGRKWLPGLIVAARASVWKHIPEDGHLAHKVLKDLDPAVREPMGLGAIRDVELRTLVSELANGVGAHVKDKVTLQAILGEWREVLGRYQAASALAEAS